MVDNAVPQIMEELIAAGRSHDFLSKRTVLQVNDVLVRQNLENSVDVNMDI